jgi:sugar (pentulose or hexulose) kinase
MRARTADIIIGLDVGTTAVKVAAFGVGGAPGLLAKALAEYPLEHHNPVGKCRTWRMY